MSGSGNWDCTIPLIPRVAYLLIILVTFFPVSNLSALQGYGRRGYCLRSKVFPVAGGDKVDGGAWITFSGPLTQSASTFG